MAGIISKELNEIRLSIPDTNNLSDDLLFGLVAFKYFYNDGKLDKSDFKNSYTDGPNDGGIDLIAVDENDLEKSLILIQAKNIQGTSSKDEIKDIFTKMAQTVQDFKNEKIGGYNRQIRRIYREKYDDACDDNNFSIKLVLFLGLNREEDYRSTMYSHLSKVDSLEDFEILIYFKNEIEQQIETFEQKSRFVHDGKIKIFKDHGVIKNGDTGILVDISAISLRELYDRYRDKGLFEQNFRYFIKNEKIDNQINDSLKNKRERFWFLNNGIIIGCKEFYIDGDNIKLIDFSIVNGCQTTTILGSYKGVDEDLDFPIPCKIVKPDKEGEDYFETFISEIAEASNSQKPISDRDLKSNLFEQRELQKTLRQHDPKIYLEIKRGERFPRQRNLQSWQRIKNDQLGQIILASILQQPGTARSSKKKIFADKATYNRIFKRRHDKETIIDLLQISHFFDQFTADDRLDETTSNVVKNGKYAVIATLCFLIKHKRKLVNLKLDTASADWASDVTADNLNGNLFNPDRPDDFEKILKSIFNQIVRSLSGVYTSRGALETSVTNFFKTDKKYHSVILERIKQEYLLDEYEYEKLNKKISLVFL